MKLGHLYKIQAKLKERIGYNGEDKLEKMTLALLVELGETANEWRGFKYWSKDQLPRPKLLEEYVDGLHFVLELGLDLGHTIDKVSPFKYTNITQQFLLIHGLVREVFLYKNKYDYLLLVELYLGLGEMLGFTSEQIEAAYLEKNRINHERQNNGY